LTHEAMREYLPQQEPRRYLYDLVADYPQRGGRGMRPTLCIATARAFGAPLSVALRTAVSIEMFHNGALIHDDIQDESDMRRGRPTLHRSEGTAMAINAGDMLLLLGLRPLIDNGSTLGPTLAMRVLQETERMCVESAEGQAIELGWRRDNVLDLSEADYLQLVLKKTCWLGHIHPLRTGALLGTGDRIDLEPFIRLGFFLGTAFQIQDDLLNLVGDPDRYGKELGGDILEGKRTLMLIHTLGAATPQERRRIGEVFAGPRAERTPEQVRYIRGLMDAYGSIAHARQVAHGLAGAALHEWAQLSAGLPESRDKRFVERLATWVIERA
ncbi:MAG: polyprenyl synthetase family protein, partial [Myxococcales bacterium]|nr:polyprenyl synthetase family protein [Myxococcales bacterium]